MSPTIRTSLKTTKTKFVVGAEGRKGTITSAASAEEEQPVQMGLVSGPSQSALRIIGLAYQEAPLLYLKG